jgi:hypothetical protein
MDFLQQKEEIESKIKNINNYWDDLKIKHQENERKKREELFTYNEPKKHLIKVARPAQKTTVDTEI